MDARRRFAGGSAVGPTAAPVARSRIAGWGWSGALGIAAAFQFGRGATLDGVILGGAAAAVSLAQIGMLRPRPALHLHEQAIGLTAAGILGAALVVAPPRSAASASLVVAIGLIALGLAWRARDRGGATRGTPAHRRAVFAWLALAVLACLWELSAFALGAWAAGGTAAHPTISALMGPLSEGQPSRTLLIAAWLAAGVLVLQRRRGSR
ncbi:hypothetical protein [Microbacterium aureliae]